jgi:hypothetical protein
MALPHRAKAVNLQKLAIWNWSKSLPVLVLEPIFDVDLQPDSMPIGETAAHWTR